MAETHGNPEALVVGPLGGSEDEAGAHFHPYLGAQVVLELAEARVVVCGTRGAHVPRASDDVESPVVEHHPSLAIANQQTVSNSHDARFVEPGSQTGV